MEIPKQLQNLKFCRVKKGTKTPFEKEWTNKLYSYGEILKFFPQENYGVLCGHHNLAVIDCDNEELTFAVEQLLPQTFSVKTGGGGTHFYYFIPELKKKIILKTENGEHLGEIQSYGTQVVGVGSIHPNRKIYEVINNVGIKTISLGDITKHFRKFMGEEEESRGGKETGELTKEIISQVNFKKLLLGYGLEKKGNNWNCPFHKSVGGQCLSVNVKKGIFNCFHCGWKGNIISFVSKVEDITIKAAIKKLKPKEEVREKEPTKKEKENLQTEFKKIYELIIKILKKYCDLDERYYSLIAIWILGTHNHNEFPTYPYLFFNAMKGSGKSRILKLITMLSKDGSLLNSLTDAVLFRTQGTLGIDEFEGLGKRGKESLTELLNSAYKKGIKVKRMRKVKGLDGENQEVEEFNVYRPILMANIRGMDEVLGDRCIQIILDKSSNPKIIKRMEIFENDALISVVVDFFYKGKCSKCRVYNPEKTYQEWDKYVDMLPIKTTNEDIKQTTTLTTHTTLHTTTTLTTLTFYEKLDNAGIDGRNLELTMPLLIIADFLGSDIFEELLETLKRVIFEKKSDDTIESLDVSLIDFVSQELEVGRWVQLKETFQNFRNFVSVNEDWFNEKWFGKALKRLNLVKDKKRMSYGVLVILDVQKAQEKIRIFK